MKMKNCPQKSRLIARAAFIKMSVKTADKIILLGVIVLIVLFVTAVCGAEPNKSQNVPDGSPTEVWEVTQNETK